MKRTMVIRVIVAVVIGVFAVGTWVEGGEPDLGWLRFFSTAVVVATITLALWDLWLWRLPVVQRIPGVPRCIRGTWCGTLTSFWIDPATGESTPPKTVYLVVRQTASLVIVKLLTDESRSASSLAAVSAIDEVAWELTYLYLNKPELRVEARSRIHHGSAVFDISGRPATRLTGRYWTDRDSKGELEFVDRDRKLADDFTEAAKLFGGTR